jgi:hypothetical protein
MIHKIVKFRGKRYKAVPEQIEDNCNGCEAIFKDDCYVDASEDHSCNNGHIYKRLTLKENLEKL